MRLSIPFVILCGVALSMAQDATLNSNSEESEILHMENTGSTDKTAINVIGNTSHGRGIEVQTNLLGLEMYINNDGADWWTDGIYSSTTGQSEVYGITSIVSGGTLNIAVKADATGGAQEDSYAYGVKASANSGLYNYGIYSYSEINTDYNWAGFFQGDVVVTGACDPCSPSDEMFKKNVQSLGGGLSKVMALKPKSYEMKTDEFKGRIALPKGNQYGLLAQDVQTVLPELVHNVVAPPRVKSEAPPKPGEKRAAPVKGEPLKFKALNYTQLIPIMLAAIQEQQAEIEALKASQGK